MTIGEEQFPVELADVVYDDFQARFLRKSQGHEAAVQDIAAEILQTILKTAAVSTTHLLVSADLKGLAHSAGDLARNWVGTCAESCLPTTAIPGRS